MMHMIGPDQTKSFLGKFRDARDSEVSLPWFVAVLLPVALAPASSLSVDLFSGTKFVFTFFKLACRRSPAVPAAPA